MRTFRKSHKLDNVCYDIRGPILKEAKRLEEEGFNIIKLNTGNPAVFGLTAPDEMLHDMILNLPNAQGYVDSKGIFPARKAIMQHYQEKGIKGIDIEDIYIGNGVSELIVMVMQGLLDAHDEILIPAPDYPLWTAAVSLAGGHPVHYICDEDSDWFPDLSDIEKKISDKTKGIVVINPNNPTGSVYPREILEGIIKLAEKYNLIVFSDEIYEKIVYDGNEHICMATLTDDVFIITMNGLSKNYRASGFRSGWMMLTGKKNIAGDYIEGLEILSNMRLCSNVPTQYAIQTALGGYQSINDLVKDKGRLIRQRDICYEMVNGIPGLSCVKPKGALYVFPKIDVEKFKIKSDVKFILDFLVAAKVLMVQGTGFNWPKPDHFRIVFLPDEDTLRDVLGRLGDFLSNYEQQ
ncbi:MAG: pyridoxal phosphate-dependent aminotransferase [Spirochaetes bacterium]|nr:pyridoxal phosphate-dependent aminotransferase [Spirochaetota bacterium]